MICVICPVLGRPARAAPLADSLREATSLPYDLVFVTSDGDDAQIHACTAIEDAVTITVPWPPGQGDYARKVNHAARDTLQTWIFQAADDLRCHPGGDVEAMAVAENMRCDVIGTNDLGNRRVVKGTHSTHSLISRSYVIRCGTVHAPGPSGASCVATAGRGGGRSTELNTTSPPRP